ncbi:hypothetical protein CP10743SC13_1816, partial [Chlamydia psittaci 10_743_SC13]
MVCSERKCAIFLGNVEFSGKNAWFLGEIGLPFFGEKMRDFGGKGGIFWEKMRDFPLKGGIFGKKMCDFWV